MRRFFTPRQIWTNCTPLVALLYQISRETAQSLVSRFDKLRSHCPAEMTNSVLDRLQTLLNEWKEMYPPRQIEQQDNATPEQNNEKEGPLTTPQIEQQDKNQSNAKSKEDQPKSTDEGEQDTRPNHNTTPKPNNEKNDPTSRAGLTC